jgi:hypothetical protein
MFQCLRWPADKGRARGCSPWHEHAESSRQGGNLACSPSPAPRRSQERSLDILLHRFRRRDARREKRREAGPSPVPNCKPVPPASSGSSSPSGNRVAVPPPPQPTDEVDVILSFAVPVVMTFLILIQCYRKFRWCRLSASGRHRSCYHPRWWQTLSWAGKPL